MSLLKYFTATQAQNFFSTTFKRLNGVSKLANLDQLNTIVDKINTANSSTYNFSSLVVSNPLGVPATILANGGACTTPGSGCWSCATSTCNYKNYKKATSFTEINPGEFRLVLDTTTPEGFAPISNVSVRVGNMTNPAYVATVTKVSNSEWIIKTYNAGVQESNLFDNTFIDIVYYYSPFEAL